MSWKILWVMKWDYAVKTNTSRWTRGSCSRRTAINASENYEKSLKFCCVQMTRPAPSMTIHRMGVMSARRDAEFTTRPDTGHQIVNHDYRNCVNKNVDAENLGT